MDITLEKLSGKTRDEHDLLGDMKVPVEYYFGVQTMRALENFHISRVKLYFFPEFIKALAEVKEAAAMANRDLGLLDPQIAQAIIDACKEVEQGKFDDQFVVDMVQGGAGTSTNMNANEVIANRALELLGHEKGEYKYCHPNNHVNLSQSTNDAYPTAIKIALIRSIGKLTDSLKELIEAFHQKGNEFAHIIKMGRTQLQDAVPMTLGQEFEAYAATLRDEFRQLDINTRLLLEINMGATAIGTGINSDPDYAPLCTLYLRKITGLPVEQAINMIESTSDTGGFVTNSATLKRLAIKLSKICNDLRLLSSGPRCGLNEINLPPMQPGSSIMPGKVNPVLCETATQVSAQVIGNDAAVAFAGTQGQFELNVFIPVMARNVLESSRLLANTARVFAEKLVDGIQPNEEHMKNLAESSPSIVTPLNSAIGYENAAKVAKTALKEGKTIRQTVIDMGFVDGEKLTEEELDKRLDVLAMANTDRD